MGTKIKVRFTTVQPILGMTSENEALYDAHIRMRDKKLGVRAATLIPTEKREQELAAIRLARDEVRQENAERSRNLFPRSTTDTNHPPIWYASQMKGFLKSSFEALLQTDKALWQKSKGCLLNPYNVKKRVDQLILVTPDEIIIHIPEGTGIGWCQRPLFRQDEHNSEVKKSSMACSEEIGAGAWFEFEVTVLNSKYVPYIKDAFAYAQVVGFGGWRGSGDRGKATFEILSEENFE